MSEINSCQFCNDRCCQSEATRALRARLSEAEGALNGVSGALCDAATIPVPPDPLGYADAVRELTAERDSLRAFKAAHDPAECKRVTLEAIGRITAAILAPARAGEPVQSDTGAPVASTPSEERVPGVREPLGMGPPTPPSTPPSPKKPFDRWHGRALYSVVEEKWVGGNCPSERPPCSGNECWPSGGSWIAGREKYAGRTCREVYASEHPAKPPEEKPGEGDRVTDDLFPKREWSPEKVCEDACAEISRLCNGDDKRWRMSIPVDPDRDSDMILSRLLNLARRTLRSRGAKR